MSIVWGVIAAADADGRAKSRVPVRIGLQIGCDLSDRAAGGNPAWMAVLR